MEQIQNHEIKDIYRIKDGLLLEVFKYESLGHRVDSKHKGKRVRGCKGLTVLTEDYTDTYYKQTYPKGTLVYHGSPVNPISDVSKFRAEVKSSGGSILGDINQINKVADEIKFILNSYK